MISQRLSSTPNTISQSEVRATGSATGISAKRVVAEEEGPIKPNTVQVKASVLQNHKLKQVLAQYINRLKKGEGENKGKFIRSDPRLNARSMQGSIR